MSWTWSAARSAAARSPGTSRSSTATLRVLATPGWCFAFADLLEQASALGSGNDDPWHRRLVRHVRDYVVGTWCEGILAAPAGFNAALHWQVRGLTVGVRPGCDLSASALRVPPEFVISNAFIARLDQLCINHQTWINDLLGLNRDQRSRGANTLLVLRDEQGLPLKRPSRRSQQVARDGLHGSSGRRRRRAEKPDRSGRMA
jgi:hypothetical protein